MKDTKQAVGAKKVKKGYAAVAALFIAVMGVAIFINQKLSDTEESLHAQRVMAEDAAMANAEKYYGEATFVNASSVPGVARPDAVQSETPSEEYFSQARLNRDTAREKALSTIKETLGNAELSEKAKNEAALLAAKTAERAEREANMENLIKAKGFKDCMVYLDGENANVVVQSEGLTANQAVQIKEIISNGADGCGEIKIVEVK